tara:strand:+ start:59 stop:460 length:402 start_codon:yes stop_codon:yes gene_type:complete
MNKQYESVKEYITDRLGEGIGESQHASDLHHYLLNEDYFIIGTYKAKQFLDGEAFNAIEKIKTYEQDNFGEVSTDLSEPEKVVNMFAYIVGEEILRESETLKDAWDRTLEKSDLDAIAEEIGEVSVQKVINSN